MAIMSKIHTVTLPDIGEGVVEGEVIEWLKKVGDPVAQDEPIVVVMTDKATVELPAPIPGKLSKQYYKPGDIAIKDKPLYDIEVTTEVKSTTPQPSPQVTITAAIPEKAPAKPLAESKALATPPTRKLAKDLGIDIGSIKGTGKEGRVTHDDVVASHSPPQQVAGVSKSGKRAAPPIQTSTPIQHLSDDEERPLIGLRHLIAEKMVESKYIVPHFAFFDQAEATRLVQLRENVKKEAQKYKFRLTYMPFFIRALSLVIKQYPQVNGSVDLQENKWIIHKQQNIGIATRTPDGLSVCVLKNVQEMSLHEIIRSYDALMKKAEEGKLERSDLIDSTITISNFGSLGGLWATPIINYPEIAILGIARIRKIPVVRNDTIVIREILNLSWSFDHRVIDGEVAALISNAYISLLENPAQLL